MKNKLLKRILLAVFVPLGSIVVIAGLLLATVSIYVAAYHGDDTSNTIQNTTRLVQASGKSLYDKDGKHLHLRGVNIGNLFASEQWLSPFSIGPKTNEDGSYAKDGDGHILYKDMPEEDFLKGFYSNPNLSRSQVDELLGLYYENWFTEQDAINIASLGMNALRVPFYWRNILNDDYTPKSELEAFRYLDPIVEKCSRHGVYVILDLHGAPGGQNGYEHSGTTACDFYTDEFIERTCTLWSTVARHYKDSVLGENVASYDLLNEPTYPAQTNSGKEVWAAEDRLYKAIRATGDKHNITIEGTWFFRNLPSPKDYGWENIQLELHWYNWGDAYPYWAMYDVCQGERMLKDFDAPFYLGEFTFFKNEAWSNLSRFDQWGYNWTFWTYKKVEPYWWDSNWALYELKLQLQDDDNDPVKEKLMVDVRSADYATIKALIGRMITDATPGVDGSNWRSSQYCYNPVKSYFDSRDMLPPLNS